MRPSGPIPVKKSRSHKNVGATYNAWSGLKQRCLNPLHPRYKDYGGRGITVCARWLDFKCFLEDMGSAPLNSVLDRVDNDRGYCKENCRWTDLSTSAHNRRLFANNSSTHKGVSYNSKSKSWYAYINIKGKRKGLGYHKTFEEAVAARKEGEKDC